MKSRISFFNKTVLLKDITRFCPIWALYLILGVLSIFSVKEYVHDNLYVSRLFDGIAVHSIVILLYAFLVAQMLFGDLFNKRLCGGLHALSLRREGWFLTHILSGLLLSIVPNLILCLLFMPRLGMYWHAAFFWLLHVSLIYLFFFGAAVFSAMCSGNRIASTVVYLLLNFGAMIVRWFVETFYEPLLYGIRVNTDLFSLFCPVLNIIRFHYSFFAKSAITLDYSDIRNETIYLAIIACTGIALLVISLLLYRRRKLECAGELMAFGYMRPVFTTLFTLSFGAVFEMIGSSQFELQFVFLVVGIIIGFFASQMLLQRSVKVFRLKPLAGLSAIGLSLALSIGLTALDPLGITRWTPDPDRVVSVMISPNYNAISTHGKPSAGDQSYTIPNEIKAITEIHRQILDEPQISDTQYINQYEQIRIVYTMADGREVTRRYYYDPTGAVADQMQLFHSMPEKVLNYKDWDQYLDSIASVEIQGTVLTGENAVELLEAIRADCETGGYRQDRIYLSGSGEYTNIKVIYKRGYFRFIPIYYSCSESINWINHNVPIGCSLEVK